MTKIDIEAVAGILRDAAEQEVLPRFRKLDDGMIRQKTSATDIVTEADEASERYISSRIRAEFPAMSVIGEESVAANPALLDGLGDAGLTAVVDPIDGTFNYAAGSPLFAVMSAIVSKGETIGGVIYYPLLDDWIIAEKGAGAFRVMPDGQRVRLKAADPVPLEQMRGYTSIGSLPAEDQTTVYANLTKVDFFASYRCAAHEYRVLAGGSVHFLMFKKVMPWDHLPGTLIAQEAGAYVANFDGSPYLATTDSYAGLVVAPDKESHEALMREVITL